MERNIIGAANDVKPTSTPDPFEVLLLEDDEISQLSSTKALTRAVPEAKVHVAATLAEGRRILAEHKPRMCVLDIQLPDGSGLDFLHDVQLHVPDASVAVLTGVPLPHYRDQAEAFGILHFMEKPADTRMLGEVAREQRDRWLASRSGNGAGFSALLTQLTTLDIIQLKCLARASVVLEFLGEQGGRGRIYFRDGEVFHAETGDLRGVDAFNEIVSWRGGRALEAACDSFPARSVEGNWQTLLMNAVHWVDERKAA